MSPSTDQVTTLQCFESNLNMLFGWSYVSTTSSHTFFLKMAPFRQHGTLTSFAYIFHMQLHIVYTTISVSIYWLHMTDIWMMCRFTHLMKQKLYQQDHKHKLGCLLAIMFFWFGVIQQPSGTTQFLSGYLSAITDRRLWI